MISPVFSIPTSDTFWNSAPRKVQLNKDEVHVWRVNAFLSRSRILKLQTFLDRAEIDRAGKFHFARDRERFIVARGMLRVILGHYLKMSPGALRFHYNAFGKAFLDGDNSGLEIQFNLTYSRGLILYAVASGRQVGIDIEYINYDTPVAELSKEVFSASETEELNGLPADLQTEFFFKGWTHKEAYLKACGRGFSMPLNELTVSLLPGGTTLLLNISNNPPESTGWCLQDLNPGKGFASALAVKGTGWKLKCWEDRTDHEELF